MACCDFELSFDRAPVDAVAVPETSMADVDEDFTVLLREGPDSARESVLVEGRTWTSKLALRERCPSLSPSASWDRKSVCDEVLAIAGKRLAPFAGASSVSYAGGGGEERGLIHNALSSRIVRHVDDMLSASLWRFSLSSLRPLAVSLEVTLEVLAEGSA